MKLLPIFTSRHPPTVVLLPGDNTQPCSLRETLPRRRLRSGKPALLTPSHDVYLQLSAAATVEGGRQRGLGGLGGGKMIHVVLCCDHP